MSIASSVNQLDLLLKLALTHSLSDPSSGFCLHRFHRPSTGDFEGVARFSLSGARHRQGAFGVTVSDLQRFKPFNLPSRDVKWRTSEGSQGCSRAQFGGRQLPSKRTSAAGAARSEDGYQPPPRNY